MLIFPAIDIISGECVRLTQGDYSKKQTYSKNPTKIAKKFEQDGASFLHIVDLDGAKIGSPRNLAQIQAILQNTNLSVQVGGGIRSFEDAKKLFDLGVDRIILGTSAVSDKSLLKKLLEKYCSQKIVVSIDARDEKVLVEGWLKNSGKTLFEFLDELKVLGVKTIIFTDIKSDGMMEGPNFSTIKQVIASDLNVIVAGGISSIKDLRKLKEIGAYGAIIGKALYEEMIDLSQAVKQFQVNKLAKRIIPCMDIKNGRVVKGTFFKDLKDAGDPVELGKKYSNLGADEIVFLDITATIERRKTLYELVKRIAANINIPFTVGGGIRSISDIRNLLNSGADKVSIGSAAVRNSELVQKAAKAFGSQCIVISVDAKKSGKSWNIFIDGGRTDTGIDAIQFAGTMERLGGGELLVNSLDRDGTKQGYDIELLKKIASSVSIPVIASSGAGKEKDFLEAFKKADVDAVLAASVFHYGQIEVPDLKKYLQANAITIRS
ncbi:MAG: imidazole glycerol phosphate synthase subunit HisF [Actinobacteria bacterium]|nr:imidazole glycerol phosphate synthase subunit HisF [Actinomycetota bacterium]